jgi:proteasome lid subunit RPN8/RPN11
VQVIGTGALGSTLADFLGRMGVEQLSLIDNDLLLPHNVARHVCRGLEIGANKAVATARAIQQLVLSGLNVEANQDSAQALLDSTSRVASERHGLVVDATASEQVRRLLAGRSSEGARIVRGEVFDRGRLGVVSVEGRNGNPDLLDLYYASCEHCAVHSENPDARRWLEEEGSADAEAELRFGLTCSSISVRLPYWCVAGHAAAFMPTITRFLDGANENGGFGLNATSEDMESRGYAWHEVPPVIPLPAGDGWEVRVHAGALTRMREERAEHLPVETGGYLYGGWNLEAKRVNVVLASGRPPETVSSPVALELGPSGQRREERQLIRRAAKRLWLVGAWHSHPNGSADLSRRDRKTWAEFHARDRHNGVPTVFVVVAGDEVRAHVRWQ